MERSGPIARHEQLEHRRTAVAAGHVEHERLSAAGSGRTDGQVPPGGEVVDQVVEIGEPLLGAGDACLGADHVGDVEHR